MTDTQPIESKDRASEKRMEESRIVALICVLLAAATLFAYWQVQSFAFVLFDDPLYILENRIVKEGLTAHGLTWAFTSFSAANWHPLTWISHMVDVEVFRFNPAGHHWTSVVIHAANGVLLFLVLRAMTQCTWPSAFVSALFALHPLHVESVAWVSERKDVLSTFFWFAAMGAYLRYVRKPGLARYGLVAFLFVLGLLSKPMVVTLPFVLMLLDLWPLNRYADTRTFMDGHWPAQSQAAIPVFFRLFAEKIPLMMLSAASAVITLYAQRAGGAFVTFESLPMGLRLANALDSCFGYLSRMVVPVNLAFFYPLSREIIIWQIAAYAILLALITALVIVAVKRYPYLFVGWFWFLGTLLPVIGIIQVGMQAMADRYTYIPLTGLFIMTAWGMKSIAGKHAWGRPLFSAIAIALIPVLVILTGSQAQSWRDSETLFTHGLAISDRNHIAHNNLAAIYLETGRVEEALPHIRRALEIYPLYAQAHGNMGAALFMQNKYEEAEQYLVKALRIDPANTEFQIHLATIMANTGKEEDAIKIFGSILQREPQRDNALLELGLIYSRAGKFREALPLFAKAARINRGHPVIQYQYGIALTQTGRPADAIKHFQAALDMWPDQVEIRNALEEAQSLARSRK